MTNEIQLKNGNNDEKKIILSDERIKAVLDDIEESTQYHAETIDDKACKVLKDYCVNNPDEFINSDKYRDVLNYYFEEIIGSVIARVPAKKGFKGKIEKLKYKNLYTTDELETIRRNLMDRVKYKQSPKIDDLCMLVMKNPYRLDEIKLRNWLDLMIENYSELLLANISNIIDAIKIDKNLPEEVLKRIKEEEREHKNENKKNKNVAAIKDEVGKKIGESISGAKSKAEYINIVVDRLHKIYDMISVENKLFTINSTLGYIQTITDDMEAFSKYVPDIKNKKENLIYSIVCKLDKTVEGNGADDAYAKLIDLSIKNLKESSTIKNVIEKLFNWPDKYLIIEKAKIVLENYNVEQNNEKKYPNDLVRYVAYEFLDLVSSENIKQDTKDTIKSSIVNFISKCEDKSLRNDVISKICDEKFCYRKEYISELLNYPKKVGLAKVYTTVLEEDFEDAKKQMAVDNLKSHYSEFEENDRSFVNNKFLDCVCRKIKLGEHLVDTIAEFMINDQGKDSRFLKDIRTKCNEDCDLLANLPDSIRKAFSESQIITDGEKVQMLKSRIKTSRNNKDGITIEKLKTDILNFINIKSSDATRLLEFILDDYL